MRELAWWEAVLLGVAYVGGAGAALVIVWSIGGLVVAGVRDALGAGPARRRAPRTGNALADATERITTRRAARPRRPR